MVFLNLRGGKMTGWIIVCILAAAAAVFLIPGYIFFKNFLVRYPDPYRDDTMPEEDFTHGFGERYKKGAAFILAQNMQPVSIKSRDHLTLRGLYFPCDGAVRTVLLAHGYHGAFFKDFSEIAEFYHAHNSNILLITERSHRESEGKYITMGIRESEDLALWCRFLNDSFGNQLPLYLHGISMGSSAVLMAQGENLPDNVRGIIADCGFSSPWEIARHVAKNIVRAPAFLLLPSVNLYARFLAHFSLKEKSVPDILKSAHIPVLFIHGTMDDFVPPHHTIRNYEACAAPKTLCLIDGATHAMSWFFDTEKYSTAVLSFLAQNDLK